MRPVLVARHISKVFFKDTQEQKILTNVTLTVDPGDYVAIIGKSHSGKSTLTRVLCGLEEISEGELYIGGHPFHTYTSGQGVLVTQRFMGVIHDTLRHQDGGLRVLESVVKSMIKSGQQIDLEWARKILHQVGLSHSLDTPINRMMGKDQLKVAIATEFAKRPVIILADEPTNYCTDEGDAEQILNLLEWYRAEYGGAIILLTQLKDEAARANRVYELRNGTLFELQQT